MNRRTNLTPLASGNHHYILKMTMSICIALLISMEASAEVITFDDNWGQAGFNLIAQDNAGVEVVFSVTQMAIIDQEIDGQILQLVQIPGRYLPNDAGAPNLPGDGRYIAIPRGAPYNPMTQGKIERYHRSLRNVVNLDRYYFPWDLEQEIGRFVDYYNTERYHESLENLTPADIYFGRGKKILDRRELVKRRTLQARKQSNLNQQKETASLILATTETLP